MFCPRTKNPLPSPVSRIPYPDSPIHPFTDSPIHPFTDSPIHPFTHSPKKFQPAPADRFFPLTQKVFFASLRLGELFMAPLRARSAPPPLTFPVNHPRLKARA